MSRIPGADALGFGFNILGDYDTTSVTSQIFAHQTMTDHQWTYGGTGITYDVPDNTSVFDDTSNTGSTVLFSGRQQFQSYFSTKASASASYGAFSGQFDFAYGQTVNTDTSYYYALSDSEFTAWQLVLTNQSTSWLSADFLNDPTVKNLPSTFTPGNQDQFFSMFRKYGTHYVSQVIVGGSLYYYEAVEKSYSSNETQIEANLKLEYKALFTSTSVESKTIWNQLGQTWANSRVVRVNCTGGDNTMLNALTPGFGDSNSGLFVTWLQKLMYNPAVVNFQLRPLDLLFSGDQATAVHQALEAYTNGAIVTYGNSDATPGAAPGGGNFTTSFATIVNGDPMQAEPPVPEPQPTVIGGVVMPIGGYQLTLLDPTSYTPIMRHLYYQSYVAKTGDPAIYRAMLDDISRVTARGYVSVLVGFAIDLLNPPTPGFKQWLTSVGAAMEGWKQYASWQGSLSQVSYICVGKQGFTPGRAVETFATSAPYTVAEPSPFKATTDASALVLTYAGSVLVLKGPHAFQSLEPTPR